MKSMDRFRVTAPAPLPFRPDHKYVPVWASILSVQQALENTEGPQIVNLYGEPGLGKSSLAKYVALYYQQLNTTRVEDSSKCKRNSSKCTLSPEISFPDGVYYILCGQNAKERSRELQLELLANLGMEFNLAQWPSTSTAAGIQECDSCTRPSFYTRQRLRSYLANKRLLIVLDDLWEAELIEELFANTKGVKYLVTSQISDIWFAAESMKLKRPTVTQARQILANYTEGLPKKGQFPAALWVTNIHL
jgi:hypothetical protein